MPEPSLEQMLKLYTKKDLWERIQQLKQQLAEKEKEIEELKKEIRDELVDNNMAILELQQSQNQTAIAELEKVKKFIIKNNEPTRKMVEITRFINQKINDLRSE